jgi:hypothetical protein
MSNSKLPERASLEYLKKLAKDRLSDLRRSTPTAKLKVDEIYELFKQRQLALVRAQMEGKSRDRAGIEFIEDLYDPFYGGRQFSIRDPNGYHLIFLQDR